MSKLTDEQKAQLILECNTYLDFVMIERIEAAATEPLLQRIAELERQLEEARNQALEEAANIAERTPKMSAYDSNMAVQDYIAKKLRTEARALKGAKE